MFKKLSQVTTRIALASFLLMMTSLPTLAQIGREPIEDPPEAASWKAFLFVFFFLVAIAIGCLMTPKRTHQD